MEEKLRKNTPLIHEVARRHGVRRLRVFGSQARDQARPDSDLDLLVDLEPERTLLDLIALRQDLEDVLGCRVDVVTESALSPHLRDEVLAQARPL